MHEASVMRHVIDAVLEQLEDKPGARVVEVVLSVGELTFLGHEQMVFAFEVMTGGTQVEGAKLELCQQPALIRCRGCSYQGPVGNCELTDAQLAHTLLPVFSCPKCKGDVDIVEGKDLVLKRVVLEVED